MYVHRWRSPVTSTYDRAVKCRKEIRAYEFIPFPAERNKQRSIGSRGYHSTVFDLLISSISIHHPEQKPINRDNRVKVNNI